MQVQKKMKIVGAVLLACVAMAMPAHAGEAPTLLGTFRDWHVYSLGTGPDRVCYALSQPKQSEPRAANRDPIFFLISTWPGRNVRGEPSVVPGYPYRDSTTARAEVGSDRFAFFTRNDGNAGGAWMEKPDDERRLVDAMKRNANMIVTGTSARGTLTRDTFSLAGVTAALDKIAADCK